MPSIDPNVVELEKDLGQVESVDPEADDKSPSRWSDPLVRLAAIGAVAILAIAASGLVGLLPQPDIDG